MDKRFLNSFTLIIVGFLFLLSSQNSFACSCLANDKPLTTQIKEAFDNSTAVFSGEILGISSKSEFEVIVKIKVAKSWKANLAKELNLTTAKDSAMCGFGFEIGQKYLVYAYGKNDTLTTNNCSRTTFESNNTDINVLDMLSQEKPKPLLIDSFNYSNSEDSSARIDNWRNALNNTPQNRGFVIVYGGKNGKRGEVEAHIRGIKQAFRLKGIDDKRVVIIKGGFREKVVLEFWVVPQGAGSPKLTPTVNSKQVRLRGVSKRIISYDCCF